MRQFLVQVDSPGDVPAFALSMREWEIGYGDAADEQEWLDAVLPERPRPHDARYFIVTAETAEVIYDAVKKTERHMRDKWHEGAPVLSVIDDREPPSYPAQEF